MGTERKVAGLSLECIEPNAAGIDVGARSIYVAVGAERVAEPVRCFATFTEDLRAMAAWLKQCGITTIAMESTGVYWVPVYEVLEDAGFKVCLVNSHHVKNVPGRKSDVSDCQWLQYLHSVGLLQASFRPERDICALRALSRHRAAVLKEEDENGVGRVNERGQARGSCLPHILHETQIESQSRIVFHAKNRDFERRASDPCPCGAGS